MKTGLQWGGYAASAVIQGLREGKPTAWALMFFALIVGYRTRLPYWLQIGSGKLFYLVMFAVSVDVATDLQSAALETWDNYLKPAVYVSGAVFAVLQARGWWKAWSTSQRGSGPGFTESHSTEPVRVAADRAGTGPAGTADSSSTGGASSTSDQPGRVQVQKAAPSPDQPTNEEEVCHAA